MCMGQHELSCSFGTCMCRWEIWIMYRKAIMILIASEFRLHVSMGVAS